MRPPLHAALVRILTITSIVTSIDKWCEWERLILVFSANEPLPIGTTDTLNLDHTLEFPMFWVSEITNTKT